MHRNTTGAKVQFLTTHEGTHVPSLSLSMTLKIHVWLWNNMYFKIKAAQKWSIFPQISRCQHPTTPAHLNLLSI
jgi:hypothetical protein